jgi:cytoskeletal protein CcmA (bactofilin family)
MFKKDQNETSPSVQARPNPTSTGKTPAAARGGGAAVIGPSITVTGDVSGGEDLVIQGAVHGTVNLVQHNVTIGPSGKVKADIHGKMVVVEGEVEGDLTAHEQIILRHTARVEGSISAPRVALEDGAVFRGGIEMDSAAKGGGAPRPEKAGSDGGSGRTSVQAKESSTSGKASSKNLSA